MERSDIPFLSASELSRLIQKKEISPVEAVEAYLERIDRVDGKLNSYITLLREEALADARQAEEEIARGESRGPMHGVPVGVKDQFFTRGIRTTAGSTILADYVPDEDATVISNLKKAGAILLGKLNMSEFAAGDTIRHPYGIPHNPWDLDQVPRRLQHRFRGGHLRFALRYIPRRGYGWVHQGPRLLLQPGRPQAQLR